jgi:Kef-type K+ transport system membrane component KefB
MPAISFSGLLVVTVVAFAAPLLLGLSPARRLPFVVLEIVAGIVIGPSGLGWVKVDLPIAILSVVGLAFLLFLAGLEVELDRLKGRILLFVGGAFALSFGLALLVGYGLAATGQVKSPLLVAIIFSATSLGIVIPLLKDAGESTSNFGQLPSFGPKRPLFDASLRQPRYDCWPVVSESRSIHREPWDARVASGRAVRPCRTA